MTDLYFGLGEGATNFMLSFFLIKWNKICHRLNDSFIRPGEQSIPTGEMGKSPLKRRRNQAINELQNLKYLPRSSVEREVVFEDRTPAHAGKRNL